MHCCLPYHDENHAYEHGHLEGLYPSLMHRDVLLHCWLAGGCTCGAESEREILPAALDWVWTLVVNIKVDARVRARRHLNISVQLLTFLISVPQPNLISSSAME